MSDQSLKSTPYLIEKSDSSVKEMAESSAVILKCEQNSRMSVKKMAIFKFE